MCIRKEQLTLYVPELLSEPVTVLATCKKCTDRMKSKAEWDAHTPKSPEPSASCPWAALNFDYSYKILGMYSDVLTLQRTNTSKQQRIIINFFPVRPDLGFAVLKSNTPHHRSSHWFLKILFRSIICTELGINVKKIECWSHPLFQNQSQQGSHRTWSGLNSRNLLWPTRCVSVLQPGWTQSRRWRPFYIQWELLDFAYFLLMYYRTDADRVLSGLAPRGFPTVNVQKAFLG